MKRGLWHDSFIILLISYLPCVFPTFKKWERMEIVGMGEEQHKEKYKRGVGDCQCQISRPDPGWCVVLRGYVLSILFTFMHQHSNLNSKVWLVCWVYLILLKSIEKAPDFKFWMIKCRIFIYPQRMPIIRIKLKGKLYFTHPVVWSIYTLPTCGFKLNTLPTWDFIF